MDERACISTPHPPTTSAASSAGAHQRASEAQRQRAEALNALSRERSRWVAFARKRVSPNDVEDVVQTALARATAKLDTLHDPDRARAWFMTLLRRTISTWHAQRSRVERLAERLEREPRVEASRSAAIDGVDRCGCSTHLVEMLTPDQAELIERVVLHDESIAQAAEAMATTSNAARVRLHRARKTLAARLEEHCGVQSSRDALDCACPEC